MAAGTPTLPSFGLPLPKYIPTRKLPISIGSGSGGSSGNTTGVGQIYPTGNQ